MFCMSEITQIHKGKTPQNIHFIVEWAEKRGLRQADIAEMLPADKGLVSRWFSGTMPKAEYLDRLAALMGTDVHGLMRHPDDDWLAKFFRDKTEQDKQKAIDMLKILFSDTRTGTDG